MKTLYFFRKGLGVFFLLSLFSLSMNAQDIHWSQFGSSPLNINPALTGMFGGNMRFVGNYRSQWNTVPVSYLTFSGAFDMKFDKFCSNHDQWSGGLIFNHDVAGDSKLQLTQLGLSGAYTHRVNRKNFLTLGVQLSGYQRRFKLDDLRFDNQFGGRAYDPNRATGENFTNTSILYGDFSAGLNWHYQKPNSFSRWNTQNRTKLDVGISAFHLNQPNKSFYEDDREDLPMRFTVHAMGTFRVADPFDVVLVGLYQSQRPHAETVLGIAGKLHLDQRLARQLNVLFGLNFRLQDAIIPNIAVQYNAWKIGLSYDINTSGFTVATDRFGGPEFSVSYIFVKPELEMFKNCNPIY